jgi:hypothetical protein
MGTTVAGILWVTAPSVQTLRVGWLTSAAFLATVALAYHAGEPYGVRRQILGSHIEQVPAVGLERAGLRINPDDLALYRAIVADIEANSKRGDAILAIPAGPEFFFLTQRRNPLPYSYVNYGVLSERTLARTLERLRLDPPKVVIHIPVLPYNTQYTDRIMEGVRANYDLIGEYREHLVYRLR